MSENTVIVGMARTPIGNFNGAFSGIPATQLGSTAIEAAVKRSSISAEQVSDVLMGCVLPAGLGQAPARQAAIGAGLPISAGATTLNKMCGSGMRTIMTADDALRAGSADIVVAGGMESMTNAPHLLPTGRSGVKYGHSEILDHMAIDGLEDAYDKRTAMGVFADRTARDRQITRDDQDEYATMSVTRAQRAISDGSFQLEITPVVLNTRKGEIVISDDEKPGLVNPDKIPQLRPAFEKDGTVTPGNASAISDGAAAVVLMRARDAQNAGAQPIARIVGHVSHAVPPNEVCNAPIKAIEKLLTKTGWNKDDVDLFEINEAFAVVAIAAIRELNLPTEKVNINGGAIALGHPIGASGTRIIITLLAALQRTGGTKGIASLCIGGGEATAVAVELIK
ncbi:MAG: acetyl-CoA C-acyltransferase [Pseudomonadota bacterium]